MINSFQKLSDLIWSPTRNDEFVAFGNDIFFFKLDPNKSTFSKTYLQTFIFWIELKRIIIWRSKYNAEAMWRYTGHFDSQLHGKLESETCRMEQRPR